MPPKNARPDAVETHPHSHGSWGYGPPINSRVCVLCRPEEEIEARDKELGQNFQKRKSRSKDSTICALLQSEERFRYKFTSDQVKQLERMPLERLRGHWTRQLEKRIKNLLPNDTKQSPMRKHCLDPAFFHVALCCRKCVEKWYGIPKNKKLSKKQLKEFEDLAMHYMTEYILNPARSQNGNETVREFMIAEYPTSNTARYDHREVRVKKEGNNLHVVIQTGKPGISVDYTKHRERKSRKRKAPKLMKKIKVKKEKIEMVGHAMVLSKIAKSPYMTVKSFVDKLETHYYALMSRGDDPEGALEVYASKLGVSTDDLRPLLNERLKKSK